MLDKPFAGFRRHGMIPEPQPCGIAPLLAALIGSVGGAIVQKLLEKPQPGQVGKAMDLNYKPSSQGALEAAQARSAGGDGQAKVAAALAPLLAKQGPAPIGPPQGAVGQDLEGKGGTPYDPTRPAYPGAPGAESASGPSVAGQGAEVGGPKDVKVNAQGEGSWMEAARMGSQAGGQIAEALTPKPGPTGGVVAGGRPTLETTLPSARERLLRYLAMMQQRQAGG